MVRIAWVNVWTRSRSWSGFIVYLFLSLVLGLSGLFLPTSNQQFLEIIKDIVRHRRPPRGDKRRRRGSESEICRNQENEVKRASWQLCSDYERANRARSFAPCSARDRPIEIHAGRILAADCARRPKSVVQKLPLSAMGQSVTRAIETTGAGRWRTCIFGGRNVEQDNCYLINTELRTLAPGRTHRQAGHQIDAR